MAKAITFIILIFFSAFFSASEIAFFSVGQAKTRELLMKRVKGAKMVWRLKQEPQRLLVTILIGNNIANILTASLATVLAVDVFGSLGVGLATGVVTLTILVFGEIIPKSIAEQISYRLALQSAPLIYFLQIIFTPLSWLLINFNQFINVRILRLKRSQVVTEDEIKALIRLGVERGAIDYRERELIENIFRFNDVTVREIMTRVTR